MRHDHDHTHHEGHAHGHVRGAPERRLAGALVLTVSFMVVEVVVGFLSGSLALLSDAGHMLTDAGALALALFAQRIAARPRTESHTFGFLRAEILGALLNGVVLGVSAAWVIVEAIRRWNDPPHVQGGWMLGTATLGLLVNLFSAYLLSRGGEGANINVRAALAHVLSDAAGSVAAIVAGLLVSFVGWQRADPAVSILISLLILYSAWRLVRSSVYVLMETVPPRIDPLAIEETIRKTPGVKDLHDLHVWMISEGFPVVMVHVVLDGKSHGTEVAREVAARVRKEHGIEHVTVQPEAPAPKDRLISVRELLAPRRPEP